MKKIEYVFNCNSSIVVVLLQFKLNKFFIVIFKSKNLHISIKYVIQNFIVTITVSPLTLLSPLTTIQLLFTL